MSDNSFTVWARLARPETCWECKRPVVIRVNRKTGREVRFNGVLAPLHTFVEEGTGHRMEVLSRDDLHVITCKGKKRRDGAEARA